MIDSPGRLVLLGHPVSHSISPRIQNAALRSAGIRLEYDEQVREVVDEIVKAIPTEERVIALDRVLAYVDKSQITPKNVEGVKADPPVIFFSKTSAVLVNIDGEPIWSPIKENDLKFAVNTNWELFQHTPTNAYYLLYNGSWLTTMDLQGTWAPAGKLPESFGKLPGDDNWKEAKAALPGKKLDAKKAPQVFVSTAPAETDPADRRAELPARQRHQGPALGQQHRERRVPRGQDRGGVLPGVRPLVLRARLQGAVDVRDPEPARRLQEDPARAPALARARVGARHAAGRRGRAAGQHPADRARARRA